MPKPKATRSQAAKRPGDRLSRTEKVTSRNTPSRRRVPDAETRRSAGDASGEELAGTDTKLSDGEGSDEEPTPKRRRLPVKKGMNKRLKTPAPARARVRKTGATNSLWTQMFDPTRPEPDERMHQPGRLHVLRHHSPLLLSGAQGLAGRRALLGWFDGVASTREMPWRKAWIDPRAYDGRPDALREALERRAYEVWISEIMLQQTRVAVVVGYWTRWMERWPTMGHLAQAEPDDVLGAWRGLGYYSRATRIHGAARLVVNDEEMRGLLPADAARLEADIPGVGRYTAGAISAIVFGRPAAMVDGNVLRVLSRQLGIYGNIKSSKPVIDVLWAAADALVKAVAQDHADHVDASHDEHASDGPGRWGQALMELGSTVCAPKPNCAVCPITSTCRAFNEGKALAGGLPKDESDREAVDMEDLCSLCEPFPDLAEEDLKEQPKEKKTPNRSISDFFFSSTEAKNKEENSTDARTLESIVAHARRFPVRVVKAAVREAETLVCAIRDVETGLYLLHRRPAKGLLAGLWELPSYELGPDDDDSSARMRKAAALRFAEKVVLDEKTSAAKVAHVAELDTVPWVFSHLKLAMHVHVFVRDRGRTQAATAERRWATADEVDAESMGTGMRKCWDLVKACGH